MSRAEFTAVNRSFEDGIRKGDAGTVASLYTADAIVLAPDAPMAKGPENIKHLWASAISGMGLKSVKLETLDLEVAGDMAHEVGEATLGLEPKTATPATAVVKYVVVWKKVGDQWRLHRDIWNAKGA
jgi:ketosteroid isomerase-like protein